MRAPTHEEIAAARARIDAATEPLDANTGHRAYKGLSSEARRGVLIAIVLGALLPILADLSRRANLHG